MDGGNHLLGLLQRAGGGMPPQQPPNFGMQPQMGGPGMPGMPQPGLMMPGPNMPPPPPQNIMAAPMLPVHLGQVQFARPPMAHPHQMPYPAQPPPHLMMPQGQQNMAPQLQNLFAQAQMHHQQHQNMQPPPQFNYQHQHQHQPHEHHHHQQQIEPEIQEDEYEKHTFEEIIDDLISRFIVNLPEEELMEADRVLWQVEQAHWFYIDFYREHDKSLPNLNMKAFGEKLFGSCHELSDILQKKNCTFDDVFREWGKYKKSVPVFGVILLNQKMTKCVLVKGWGKFGSWQFPKGKLNSGEDEFDCAVREALEEIGYDASEHMDPNVSLERSHGGHKMKLFIGTNVPEDTMFETKTRKEISAIRWFRIDSILNDQTGQFAGVLGMVTDLKTWINKKRGKGKAGQSSSKEVGVGKGTKEVGTKAVKEVGTKAVKEIGMKAAKEIGTKEIGTKEIGTKEIGTKEVGAKASSSKDVGSKSGGAKEVGTKEKKEKKEVGVKKEVGISPSSVEPKKVEEQQTPAKKEKGKKEKEKAGTKAKAPPKNAENPNSMDQLDETGYTLGAWDQFSANETMFGVNTEYDYEEYTTKLPDHLRDEPDKGPRSDKEKKGQKDTIPIPAMPASNGDKEASGLKDAKAKKAPKKNSLLSFKFNRAAIMKCLDESIAAGVGKSRA